VDIQRHGDVAVLHLRGGKANAMEPGFLADLIRLIDEAEPEAGAIVLTGYDTFFSAGLALPVLVDLDREAMREFMALFSRAMLRVLRCDRPVVAAINGHAIAGGCVLALQCDVRMMVEGGGRIGLNEVQLGLGLPALVVETLRLRVPPASIVPIAFEGQLLSPHAAGALGLIDAVVEPDALLERAIERANVLAALPPAGFAQVKRAWRRPAIEAMEQGSDPERDGWLDSWFSSETQARIAEVVANLSRRGS
jgi:enoyl-CoA hydratase/carnithine racemase